MAMEKTPVRDERVERKADMLASAAFQTPHYVVLISKMTGGPETYDELRMRYVIVSIEHGIILGSTSSFAQAMMGCLQEEATLIQAKQIAVEATERAYLAPQGAPDGPSSPVNGAPKFT